MSYVRVRMDPAPVFAMKVMFRGSPVDENIRDRTKRVANLAFILCPKKSGKLASTIRAGQARTDKGVYSFGYDVIAGGPQAPYVEFVHDGVAPHILPQRTGSPYAPGRPVVWWRSPGGPRLGLYSMGPISHPGNKAQPFLSQALVAAAG